MDPHIGKVTTGVMMKTIMKVVDGMEAIAAGIQCKLIFVHLVNASIHISTQKL